MAKNLLIVESPAKAKTIEKILGPDFVVKSSFGHIRDLEKGNKGIDIQNNFQPNYVVSPEKVKVVKELRDHVKKATEVWLATDEDREGEAISWHLCQELNLDVASTKRIVFSEITKPAIQKAVSNPRLVDVNLVNAQQARRILDRIVGFELSEVLWRKVKNKLSAGRVQSVAVKLIVDREREIQHFQTASFFKIYAYFTVDNGRGEKVILKSEYTPRFDHQAQAVDFLEKANGAVFTIESIDKKPVKRFPAPPFTTSTLQQEASRKLGFSVNRTMSTAQRLYEAGYISYMRTDSSNLSDTAMDAIRQEITSSFGDTYYHARKFKSKTANAQEAHEAIRPTYMDRRDVGPDRDQQKLYDLIWKRAIASQMSEAEIEKTIVKIDISSMPGRLLEAVGEVLKFDGFLKVYLESKDEEEEDDEIKGMLPPLSKGQQLALSNMEANESYTRPPARYTEASLVKKLEELGIGRPSTYAPTISKIMEEERGYVTKESREGVPRHSKQFSLKGGVISSSSKTEMTGATKNCLYPSDLGMVVSDFLSEHFGQIMDYGFTANVEDQLDKIAVSGVDWRSMLQNFYGPFHEVVENTLEHAERAKGKRELGKADGFTVLAQMTRFGPVIQIGDREELKEGEKPRFANLKPGQSLETITFEEAMELFQLPRTLGKFAEEEEITVNTGRYGPYLKVGDMYVNLPRNTDPMHIEHAQAVALIQEKMDENAPIGLFRGMPVTKGKGRFGPFVKWKDLFVNIPVRYKLDTITIQEASELIEAKLEKEANRYIQQWESEKISIENGRWGPYIKFGKLNVKIPKMDGEKASDEYLKSVPLEVVKQWIEAEVPGAFGKKETKKKK